jgi:hypothetical protein
VSHVIFYRFKTITTINIAPHVSKSLDPSWLHDWINDLIGVDSTISMSNLYNNIGVYVGFLGTNVCFSCFFFAELTPIESESLCENQ